MSRQIFIFISMLILVYIGLCGKVLAWDNERTHKDLSGIASEHSVLTDSRGNYLKKIGFGDGLDETFKWGLVTKTVKQWLQEGAFMEDKGSTSDAVWGQARYNNHFHNPLKPWSKAGLSDLQSGESSVLWAQDNAQDSAIGGNWSWLKVRYCFYNALTAKKESDRQSLFACAFEVSKINSFAVTPLYLEMDSRLRGNDRLKRLGYFEASPVYTFLEFVFLIVP